jgi:signal transduction histidine kinase
MIGGEAIGVLALADSHPNRYSNEHIRLTEVIVAQASVAIQNAWLFEQVRAGHERLQSLSRRLVEIQESERRYISRELHDVASQALTAIMYGLRILEQEAHQPDSILQRLTELKRLTDSVLDELHRLAIGLRPASLDYLGLEVALEQLVKNIREHYGISTHFKTIGATKGWRLSEHIETNIYRIVQESLTNAVRHAQAKNIDVILECQEEKSIIMVEDDGKGFDTSQIPKSGHLGLLGMQERAQMIPGALLIESVPGCGTTIVLEVPYGNTNIDSR